MIGATLGFGAGLLCGAGALFFGVGGAQSRVDAYHDLADETGGVVLIGPGTWQGKVIDAATGRGGFAHCGLYLGMVDKGGGPLLVHCYRRRGVEITALSTFDGCLLVWIPMDHLETTHARGAAMALLGAPYRGRGPGLTCGEFVMRCLPRNVQQEIRQNVGHDMVTPNDLARAFGATATRPRQKRKTKKARR